MSKKKIEIIDFDLFVEMMKTTAKIVDSAKLIISPNGVEIYGAHGNIGRCEFTSNAIRSVENIEFAIDKLAMFNKILLTIKDEHESDYSGLNFTYEQPFMKFESKKIKLKYHSINEDKIIQWISKKVTTSMTSVFDFMTTPTHIKKILGHSYLFTDPKAMKVYLETKPDMEQNTIYGTIGNKQTEIGNEITLKFGLVTYGAIPEGRFITIDLERIQLLSAIQCNEIKISLMDKNVLTTSSKQLGKNNSYFNIDLYLSMTK